MNTDRSYGRIVAATIAVVTAALVLAVFAWWQIRNYEEGVAEIYAAEQDGYVEVVARSIRKYGEVAGPEFVEDTIGFLDSTSQRYWTLDNTRYFVFVKSVYETDIYKTFSTETFYNTDSSQSFLDTLRSGEVVHDIINLNGYKYIASGTVFEFEGEEYRLCLLTDYDVMLSDNSYLNSKIYLFIDYLCLIGLLVIAVIYFMINLEKARAEAKAERSNAKELSRYIEFLDNVIMGRNGTAIITGEGQIMRLLHRLDERGVYPMAFILFNIDSKDMMNFYDDNHEKLGNDVVWVRCSAEKYILLKGNSDGDSAIRYIKDRLGVSDLPGFVACDTAVSDRRCTEVYSHLQKEY